MLIHGYSLCLRCSFHMTGERKRHHGVNPGKHDDDDEEALWSKRMLHLNTQLLSSCNMST